MSGEHILLVEDEEQIRKLLSAFLERRGYRVSLAIDGLDALRNVKTAALDLVITDLNMPRMNGLELMATLRQYPETGMIPIVMLSAQRSAEDIALGLAKGADAYVPKPVEMSLLASTVELLLHPATT